MLELRSVSKRFSGIVAVDEVSWSAGAGEVTGYLGPNGSGKSTTIKMITGLIDPTSGEILFDGEPIRRDPIGFKRRVGYVPEEPHLYAHLSGSEYLTMVAQLRDLPSGPTAARIDELLRLFALYGDRHAPISAYSKGIYALVATQRVAVAAPPLGGLLLNLFTRLGIGHRDRLLVQIGHFVVLRYLAVLRLRALRFAIFHGLWHT